MPPSRRATSAADGEDEPAEQGEQHALQPLLNIDTAVNAAVERALERHQDAMVARMIAAMENVGPRSNRADSDSPAAGNEQNALNGNLDHQDSSVAIDAVGTILPASGVCGSTLQDLSNEPSRATGRSRGDERANDAGGRSATQHPANQDDPDDDTSPNMEISSATVAKLISGAGETPCPYDIDGNPFFRPPAFRTRGLSYSPEDAGDHYHTPLQRQLRGVIRGDPAPPDESSWLIRLYVPDRSDYRFRWHFRSSLTPCSRDTSF